jgi:putative membrane protein
MLVSVRNIYIKWEMKDMMDRFFDRGLVRDYGFRSDMMNWVSSNGWIGWLVMGLCMLIVIAIVVAGVILIAKAIRHSNEQYKNYVPPTPPTIMTPAMKLLDERYAKGEITDEEYKTKKENLK